MKICLITEEFYPEDNRAVAIILSQLIRYLYDTYKDLEIDIVTSANLSMKPNSKLPLYEEWNGIKIFRICTPKSKRPSMFLRLLAGILFTLRATLKVRRLHHQKTYDLIVLGTNPPSSPLTGRLMSLQTSVPYLYLVHDLYPDIAVKLGALSTNSLVKQAACLIQQQWLTAAKAIVVVGRCMRDHLIKKYHLPLEKIHVITNWSDPSIIMSQDKETNFRSKYKLAGFLVIYAGNIGYAQRLDTVLNAAKIIEKTHSDITFVLVGQGNAFDYLHLRIQNETILNVHLIPTVQKSEYPEVLASSDVSLISIDTAITGLAVPSKFYNILAAGRPIIAILDKNTEIAAVLREIECGIQVDHDNGSQLANAIITMYSSSSFILKHMGEKAYNTSVESYRLQIIADRYYRLFHELVSL